MIFPRVKEQTRTPGTYACRQAYPRDILSLYRLAKAGTADITTEYLPGLGREEYRLSVREEGILIRAACDEGLFRAVTSLHQMLVRQQGNLACCEIRDEPTFPRRGYMLDISRSKMPTLQTLKELVDLLALLKYNELQLYMESHCFHYPSFPQYTADFDCLSGAELEELDRYCAERFIDLVPNQNSFGHLAAWLKEPELRHLGLTDGTAPANTLNPLLPESFDFVQKLYADVLPHFRSDYVNIGLDEAYGLGKFQSEAYCRKHGKETLFVQWLNQLNRHIKQNYGKKVMFWADMIAKNEDICKVIPKDCIALEWGYEYTDVANMTANCARFRDLGIDYYVCPSCNTHAAITGRLDATLANIQTCAKIGAKYGAKGLLITDWGTGHGEPGHPHFFAWSLIPCALAALYAWNPNSRQGMGFCGDYLREAERFTDDFIFDGKPVSALLNAMSNFYLLEPARIPVANMCGLILCEPLSKTTTRLFDLKAYDAEFFFSHVVAYMSELLKKLAAIDFAPIHKREILLNGQMVILSAELCMLRGKQRIPRQTAGRLCALIDRMLSEYRELWLLHNYEEGVENFLQVLRSRRKELQEMAES